MLFGFFLYIYTVIVIIRLGELGLDPAVWLCKDRSTFYPGGDGGQVQHTQKSGRSNFWWTTTTRRKKIENHIVSISSLQ